MPKLLLPTVSLRQCVSQWLSEDVPSFDYGGQVVGDKPSVATMWMKATGVVAGVPFVDEIFRQLNCSVEWRVAEGEWLDIPRDQRVAVAVVRGSLR
jgi:nicotinate-nucleotide pyrophosphorylase (carboxylating)